MAYELHIERPPQGIPIHEWLVAVQATPGLRLTDAQAQAVNPTTGARIVVPSAVGSVQVLTDSGEWSWAFRFSDDRATFKATESIESPSDPTHVAASLLAKKLGAQIVGDEGESYDW